jgi:hypothetical protein
MPLFFVVLTYFISEIDRGCKEADFGEVNKSNRQKSIDENIFLNLWLVSNASSCEAITSSSTIGREVFFSMISIQFSVLIHRWSNCSIPLIVAVYTIFNTSWQITQFLKLWPMYCNWFLFTKFYSFGIPRLHRVSSDQKRLISMNIAKVVWPLALFAIKFWSGFKFLSQNWVGKFKCVGGEKSWKSKNLLRIAKHPTRRSLFPVSGAVTWFVASPFRLGHRNWRSLNFG